MIDKTARIVVCFPGIREKKVLTGYRGDLWCIKGPVYADTYRHVSSRLLELLADNHDGGSFRFRFDGNMYRFDPAVGS